MDYRNINYNYFDKSKSVKNKILLPEKYFENFYSKLKYPETIETFAQNKNSWLLKCNGSVVCYEISNL